MTEPRLGGGLLVASRGLEPTNGLYHLRQRSSGWAATQLETVAQLSSLAAHPTLPVVYGTSGTGNDGAIHAWRLEAADATLLGQKSSEGAEPCHLAIDPSGRLLVAANYTSNNLTVQPLAADGNFDGKVSLLRLEGSGPDPDRQEAAHPHQVLFHDGVLFVVDLGADLLRQYAVNPATATLTPIADTPVPPGTGPRHAVVLDDGRFALSGELSARVVVGRPGDKPDLWKSAASTTRTGPAKTRHKRNYPGDIQRSPDGRHVYLANRGYDTIAAFDVTGDAPVLVAELDSTVAWPQHMLVRHDALLVAGWDSSRVVRLPLDNGLPGAAEPLFDIAGAGWLLAGD